ncbi:MAG: hypothetical protein WC869_10755 [Phycisphaerae bacterium]
MSFVEKHRHSLLSVVMLAIFAASVLTAWSLVRTREAPVTRGAAIMRQIQTRTLSLVMPRELVSRWYLLRDRTGVNLGFTAHASMAIDGAYAGFAMVYLPSNVIYERWQLSKDARTGSYVAPTSDGAEDFIIVLKEGKVAIALQHSGRRVKLAPQDAPDNYIPEGLMHPVISLVAREGQKAMFKSIFNVESVVKDRFYFTTVTLTPMGPNKVRLEAELPLSGDRLDQVYKLDAGGQIIEIDDIQTGQSEKLVAFDDLLKVFPQARQYKPKDIPLAEPDTQKGAVKEPASQDEEPAPPVAPI